MDTRDGRIYSAEQVALMGEIDRPYMKPMEYDPTPEQRATGKVSRNHPCPCGSGKKFKKCCLWRVESAKRTGGSDEVARLRDQMDELKRQVAEKCNATTGVPTR